MKTAVVTGASGMLGSYLACELHLKGYSVKCIQHKTGPHLFKKICAFYNIPFSVFEWRRADILDTDSLVEAFDGADVVFHCAALVLYRKKDEDALYQTNVLGTRNCCNTCLKLHIPVFIHASSTAAIGRASGTNEVDENTEYTSSRYNSPYAQTKHLAEQEVWRAAEEGLKVGIVNPGIIFGVGDGKSGSNGVFHHIQKSSAFYPKGRTGFVGAADVAKAMISVFENAVFNRRILLVSENLYFRDMLKMVARLMHKKAPGRALDGILLHLAIFVANFCETFRIPFPFPAKGLISSSSDTLFKTKNAHLLPGFQFTPVIDVLAETIPLLPKS